MDVAGGDRPDSDSDSTQLAWTGCTAANPTGTTLTSQPSRIMQELNAQYSADKPYFHSYGGAGPGGDVALCKLSQAWCNSAVANAGLPAVGAFPGQNAPIQDRGVGIVSAFGIGGPVQNRIDPTTQSVFNITLPGHVFYDGAVERRIVQDDTYLYVRTTGVGNNQGIVSQFFNQSNGITAFIGPNINLRNYMRNQWLQEQRQRN